MEQPGAIATPNQHPPYCPSHCPSSIGFLVLPPLRSPSHFFKILKFFLGRLKANQPPRRAAETLDFSGFYDGQ
ncbi:MAG: hypothetical protein MUF49_27310 [Oculatellaceae cyanobacterium Prado106]|nr:hypothetical protein [Oculatellaceae cyanobacterium Prado106]